MAGDKAKLNKLGRARAARVAVERLRVTPLRTKAAMGARVKETVPGFATRGIRGPKFYGGGAKVGGASATKPAASPPPGWVAAAKRARAQQAVQLSAEARALAKGSGGKAAPGGHRSAGDAARALARGSGWTAPPGHGPRASTPTPAAGGKGSKPKGGGGKGKGHGAPGSAKHGGGEKEGGAAGKGRSPSNLGALGGFARQAAAAAAGVVMSAAQKVASKVPQG